MPLLNVFGELESFASGLYPYRFIVTPLLAIGLLVALYGAYRAGVQHFLLRHRFATAAIGVPVLVMTVIAGDYLLSPLWERSHLNEPSPIEVVVAASSASGEVAQPVAMTEALTQASVRLRGIFKGADDFHFGRGDAQIIRTAEGSHVLRLENFSVRNGPDLYVYLSTDMDGKRVEERLNLGRLKATDGAFNYDIPDGIDLAGVQSVIVWCRQFSTLFAVAALM